MSIFTKALCFGAGAVTATLINNCYSNTETYDIKENIKENNDKYHCHHQRNLLLTPTRARLLFQKVQDTKQPLQDQELNQMQKYYNYCLRESNDSYQAYLDQTGEKKGALFRLVAFGDSLDCRDKKVNPTYPICWTCGVRHHSQSLLLNSWKQNE